MSKEIPLSAFFPFAAFFLILIAIEPELFFFMKKYIILTGLILLPLQLLSKNASLFSYNRIRVEKALHNATVLDQYVSHNHLQIHRINPSNPLLANFKVEFSFPALKSNALSGIPGCFLGFCFGPVGVLIVYLAATDKSQKEGALVGCVLYMAVMTLFIIDMFQSFNEKNIGGTGIPDELMRGCI